jgi:hypothetical protein
VRTVVVLVRLRGQLRVAECVAEFGLQRRLRGQLVQQRLKLDVGQPPGEQIPERDAVVAAQVSLDSLAMLIDEQSEVCYFPRSCPAAAS